MSQVDVKSVTKEAGTKRYRQFFPHQKRPCNNAKKGTQRKENKTCNLICCAGHLSFKKNVDNVKYPIAIHESCT